MPFGLKNVRATYQRLVTKIFHPLLGNIVEAFIDDLLVKTTPSIYRKPLLGRYDIKLNPLKCVFRVSSGKFLGFMVTHKGIEANHIQLKVIMDSQAPTSRKEVQ